MGDDVYPLTRAAFSRFWFRYDESDETALIEYAKTYPAAAATLARLRAEVAEWWPILVGECGRGSLTAP
jgi:hypothetical protein